MVSSHKKKLKHTLSGCTFNDLCLYAVLTSWSVESCSMFNSSYGFTSSSVVLMSSRKAHQSDVTRFVSHVHDKRALHLGIETSKRESHIAFSRIQMVRLLGWNLNSGYLSRPTGKIHTPSKLSNTNQVIHYTAMNQEPSLQIMLSIHSGFDKQNAFFLK